MSGDAADSTDTRHEPDQVEPGKEGLGWQGHQREGKEKEKKIKKGNVGAGSFSPCFFSAAVAAVAAWELIRNVLRARIALVS